MNSRYVLPTWRLYAWIYYIGGSFSGLVGRGCMSCFNNRYLGRDVPTPKYTLAVTYTTKIAVTGS